jgi:hypothetical protein
MADALGPYLIMTFQVYMQKSRHNLRKTGRAPVLPEAGEPGLRVPDKETFLVLLYSVVKEAPARI